MRLVAIHDARGEMEAVIIGPPDESAPMAAMSAPGRFVSVVEGPEVPQAAGDDDHERQVLGLLEHYRVERASTARLVRRDDGEPQRSDQGDAR